MIPAWKLERLRYLVTACPGFLPTRDQWEEVCQIAGQLVGEAQERDAMMAKVYLCAQERDEARKGEHHYALQRDAAIARAERAESREHGLDEQVRLLEKSNLSLRADLESVNRAWSATIARNKWLERNNELWAMNNGVKGTHRANERLYSVVKQLEWCGVELLETGPVAACPFCHAVQDDEHDPACPIGIALSMDSNG